MKSTPPLHPKALVPAVPLVSTGRDKPIEPVTPPHGTCHEPRRTGASSRGDKPTPHDALDLSPPSEPKLSAAATASRYQRRKVAPPDVSSNTPDVFCSTPDVSSNTASLLTHVSGPWEHAELDVFLEQPRRAVRPEAGEQTHTPTLKHTQSAQHFRVGGLGPLQSKVQAMIKESEKLLSSDEGHWNDVCTEPGTVPGEWTSLQSGTESGTESHWSGTEAGTEPHYGDIEHTNTERGGHPMNGVASANTSNALAPPLWALAQPQHHDNKNSSGEAPMLTPEVFMHRASHIDL